MHTLRKQLVNDLKRAHGRCTLHVRCNPH